MRLRSPNPFLLWLLLAGALIASLDLAEDVYRNEGFSFDAPILAWLYAHRTPIWTR